MACSRFFVRLIAIFLSSSFVIAQAGPVATTMVRCDLFNKLEIDQKIEFSYMIFSSPHVWEALSDSLTSSKPTVVSSQLVISHPSGRSTLERFDLQFMAKKTPGSFEPLMYVIDPITMTFDGTGTGRKNDYTLTFAYDNWDRPIMSLTLVGLGMDARGVCYNEVSQP